MIYLDNNATTSVDPLVHEEINFFLKYAWGNPSSIHEKGQEAKKALLKAQVEIAGFFGVSPEEIIFTSGATESLNMVLRGVFGFFPKGHLITSSVEHDAVYQTAKALERGGVEVSYLIPRSGSAEINPTDVEAALRLNTRLIALMWANNETGNITDINAIAKIASKAKVPLLVDGVALIGKEQFVLPEAVSAFCISGHKIHAAKGVGLTVLRKNTSLEPLITGGFQQEGKRGGTENLPAIAGLCLALSLIKQKGASEVEKIRYLRDLFEKKLLERFPNIKINGEGKRVSNTSNLSFMGIGGETLLIALDQAGIPASHGSACSSGALEPSRVLVNMGLSKERVNSSIRFSLSCKTTTEEIDEAIKIITSLVSRLTY